MQHRAYKYPLHPTQEQQQTFDQWIGVCRMLWNTALEQRKLYGNKISYFSQQKELTLARKEFDWVEDVPLVVCRSSLVHLDNAFKNFFRKKRGYPKFKSKNHHRKSFSIRDNLKTIHIREKTDRWAEIKLPKMGWVKFRNTRDIPEDAVLTAVHVSCKNDQWWVSVVFKRDVEVEYSDSVVGLDRGVVNTITLSDGTICRMPDRIKKMESNLRRQQKKLARVQKGSNRRKKQVRRIGRLHEKIANARNDFLHKATTEISRNHGKVVLEDPRTKDMTGSAKGTIENPGSNVKAKSGLNRSILRQGWGTMEQMLSYKTNVVKVNPAYTSQICSNCGFKDKSNRNGQSFECVSCGHSDDADVNAAINILAVGNTVAGRGGLRQRAFEASMYSERA